MRREGKHLTSFGSNRGSRPSTRRYAACGTIETQAHGRPSRPPPPARRARTNHRHGAAGYVAMPVAAVTEHFLRFAQHDILAEHLTCTSAVPQGRLLPSIVLRSSCSLPLLARLCECVRHMPAGDRDSFARTASLLFSIEAYKVIRQPYKTYFRPHDDLIACGLTQGGDIHAYPDQSALPVWSVASSRSASSRTALSAARPVREADARGRGDTGKGAGFCRYRRCTRRRPFRFRAKPRSSSRGAPDGIFHLAAIVSGEAELDFDKGYRDQSSTARAISSMRSALLTIRMATSLALSSPRDRRGRSALPFPIPDDYHLTRSRATGTQKAICEAAALRLQPPRLLRWHRHPPCRRSASGPASQPRRLPASSPISARAAGRPGSRAACFGGCPHWHTSPRSAVGFLIHGATIDLERSARGRNLSMPGLSATWASRSKRCGALPAKRP